MSRSNSQSSVSSFDSIVNGLTALAVIALIAAGYLAAFGSFAGAA